MGNGTLDPRSLTSEERAWCDAIAVALCSSGNYSAAGAISEAVTLGLPERRALFGEPASEGGKVECPNCLQPEEHPHFAGNLTGDGGWYFCPGRVPQAADKRKPSQPELSGHDSARSGQPASEPAKVEPATAISPHGVWRCECCAEIADPMDPRFRWNGECWQHHHAEAQTHFDCRFFGPQPEPVATVGEMPEEDLTFHINRLERMLNHNVIVGDAKESVFALIVWARTHAAQPAPAVAMSPELALVLDECHDNVCEYRRHADASPKSKAAKENAIADELAAAIAAVRAQAEEAGKVPVEAIRCLLIRGSWGVDDEAYQAQKKAAVWLAELDAAEGRK